MENVYLTDKIKANKKRLELSFSLNTLYLIKHEGLSHMILNDCLYMDIITTKTLPGFQRSLILKFKILCYCIVGILIVRSTYHITILTNDIIQHHRDIPNILLS